MLLGDRGGTSGTILHRLACTGLNYSWPALGLRGRMSKCVPAALLGLWFTCPRKRSRGQRVEFLTNRQLVIDGH